MSVVAPTLSIIIVNYRGGDDLLACIRSVDSSQVPTEVIVVNNDRNDTAISSATELFPHVRIIESGANLGFGAAANLGVSLASGPLLLFLNPDVRLKADCIRHLCALFQNPRLGVAGPVVHVQRSGEVDFGATIDACGFPVGISAPNRPLYVHGAALATRRTTFNGLGGFDDRYFLFAEDVDYCWRALIAGWDVGIAAGAVVDHQGGASISGGYVQNHKLVTQGRRVYLRERNTLATILKCYAGSTLIWVLPLFLVQSVATSFVLAVTGSPRAAFGVFRSLWWNARELRTTLRLRKLVQQRRRVPDREIQSRMHRGVRKLQLLIRFGPPHVTES